MERIAEDEKLGWGRARITPTVYPIHETAKPAAAPDPAK
ncbi:hypothetical protein FTUN_7666 [Frigoriglobus tundricola]|uniref:Uncharacterized protein n=2 Tax=Frigoriglobus tundricola TaxID=2774151 RepID=A0A6M5Z4A8_9BACT|nr:hypothetical protein FTUN_7666 [Frigoriglobus tundricola]